MTSQQLFRIKEFAEKAGVTVRTLHHYHRLGLFEPSGRSEKGYRLYSEQDFAPLQQVVTLKFLGFTLKEIKGLFEREPPDLLLTLRRQRSLMEEKRRRMDQALTAIGRTERMLASGGKPNWEAFVQIIEVTQMQTDTTWMKKYYSTEAQADLAERGTPEAHQKGQEQWTELIREVEASLGEDPAGEKAQALATRWSALIEAFTGGNPAVAEGVNKLYADRNNWPGDFKKPYSDEVGQFIARCIEIGKQSQINSK